MSAPLSGLRVIDFGQYIAAPGAGQNLADLGADVIKVEAPSGDQARSIGHFGTAMVRANNHNKRSIAIDMRSASGREIAAELIASADVVLHNFRHGVSERLGLDAATLLARHPSLVYGFVTGFGTNGPNAKRVGLDIAAQAEFALMDLTGEADGDPQRIGLTIADVLAAQALTSGVLAALVGRAQSGRGSVVETSLMEAVVQALASVWTEHELTGAAPTRRGHGQAAAAPAADLVRTSDGGALVVSAYTAEKFAALCELIGRPELVTDPRFADNAARVANRAELLQILQGTLGGQSRANAAAALQKSGIVCGAVRRFDEIVDDADLRASGLIQAFGAGERAYSAPGLPFSLNSERSTGRSPAPELGEHTHEILGELGYDDQKIGALLRDGVVVQSDLANQQQPKESVSA